MDPPPRYDRPGHSLSACALSAWTHLLQARASSLLFALGDKHSPRPPSLPYLTLRHCATATMCQSQAATPFGRRAGPADPTAADCPAARVKPGLAADPSELHSALRAVYSKRSALARRARARGGYKYRRRRRRLTLRPGPPAALNGPLSCPPLPFPGCCESSGAQSDECIESTAPQQQHAVPAERAAVAAPQLPAALVGCLPHVQVLALEQGGYIVIRRRSSGAARSHCAAPYDGSAAATPASSAAGRPLWGPRHEAAYQRQMARLILLAGLRQRLQQHDAELRSAQAAAAAGQQLGS